MEMKSTPHPGRGTLPPGKQPTATQRPASSPTTPPHAESSTGTTIVRFGIGFLILLFVMGIFDFHPLLLIGLMVIAFSMVETLRTSAKAAGRKTTSMFDPNRRDIR